MGYLAIAYPCGCTTNDEFTASRKTCEHGNSYHMARSVSRGLRDNLDKRRRGRGKR